MRGFFISISFTIERLLLPAENTFRVLSDLCDKDVLLYQNPYVGCTRNDEILV